LNIKEAQIHGGDSEKEILFEHFTLEALIGRISALPERTMQVALIRRWVRFGDPQVVAEQLEEMVIRAMKGEEKGKAAHLSFLMFILLSEEEDELALDAIDLAAESCDLLFTVDMLSDPPPHRQLGKGERSGRFIDPSTPLGTRKAMARSRDRKCLERLLFDPSPPVIALLCANPRITEDWVVTIVAKRPNWTDILDEVARSRWIVSKRVREALIQNAYVRTGLAINLLPHSGVGLLRSLRYWVDVHPRLKKVAIKLLDYRD
jgi:hypothetical protein